MGTLVTAAAAGAEPVETQVPQQTDLMKTRECGVSYPETVL